MERDQKKERKKRNKLLSKYGHLIGSDTKDIPKKHRAPNGGLRCFRRVSPRDEHGNKIISDDVKKIRCKNVCAKGSLYCRHHGGANSKALVSGKFTNRQLDKYKKSFGTKLGDVMEVFINDPDILSHKRELATLRTILVEYIKKFSTNKPIKNSKKLIHYIENVLAGDHFDAYEKFKMISDIVNNERTITDDDVIDRVSRLVDNIGRAIDRIDKIERKSDYFLTPEGLKVIIRSTIETIKAEVKDPIVLAAIGKSLLEIHTKTHGEITVKNEADQDK